jgi:hypothetical protein
MSGYRTCSIGSLKQSKIDIVNLFHKNEFFNVSSNHSSIKVSVLNRLGHVRGADLLIFFEIGDGPCNFQYSRIGPGAHTQFVDSHFQKPLGFLVDDAVLPDLLVGHVRIAERRLGREAILLTAAGGIDPALYGSRRFTSVFSFEIPVSDGRHLNVNIDPVHQRARNAGLILADLLGRAPAGLVRIAKMTAGA